MKIGKFVTFFPLVFAFLFFLPSYCVSSLVKGVQRIYFTRHESPFGQRDNQCFFVFSLSIDGFHSDVIKLLSQNSEVLQILIYTRSKINKN